MKNFELISFDICPYVQRSVIVLHHKKVEFKLTFIDLNKTPQWFDEMSPFGKVPLLLVRNTPTDQPEVLFESAIINEYLDEVTPAPLIAKDSLQKAKERAWIEVSSELLGLMYSMMMEDDEAESLNDFWELLAKVEEQLPNGNYFRGNEFSLVDAAFAPVFVRTHLFRALRESAEWKKLPKAQNWAQHLCSLPEVQKSMIPNFKARYREMMVQHESRWATEID